MKRLTEKGFNYSDAAIVENMRMVTVSAAMNRLAAYEDTGLTPEKPLPEPPREVTDK